MRLVIFTFILVCFSTTFGFGQAKFVIEYMSGDAVSLNGQSISNETSFEEVVKIIGEEPELYKAYQTGKSNYHYKDLGVVVHTYEGKLLSLGVNYNWDGDETFPESVFEGEFKIGKISMDKESKPEIVEQMGDFEIKCIVPQMCMNNPQANKNPILFGFEDGLITQIRIEFH